MPTFAYLETFGLWWFFGSSVFAMAIGLIMSSGLLWTTGPDRPIIAVGLAMQLIPSLIGWFSANPKTHAIILYIYTIDVLVFFILPTFLPAAMLSYYQQKSGRDCCY